MEEGHGAAGRPARLVRLARRRDGRRRGRRQRLAAARRCSSGGPGLRGIVFDLPETYAIEAALGDRCTSSAELLRRACRPGDVFVLSTVLHDWDDERAAAILRTIRAGAPADARLVLIEAVVPAGNEPDGGKWLDLLVLALFGGRERDEEQWRELLDGTGSGARVHRAPDRRAAV